MVKTRMETVAAETSAAKVGKRTCRGDVVAQVPTVVESDVVDLGVQYPMLASRPCSNTLVTAMKLMNVRQKKDVVDIGFGMFFDLHISEVSTRMAYWVLDHFDPIRCEIKLEDNRSVRIEASDVHRVFGMPNGICPIKRMKKQQKCKLLTDWHAFFQKDKKMIGAKDVSVAMMGNVDGGYWFKIHFLVLLTACLIESTGNGYITPQIMSSLDNLEKVSELEWCEYVIRALVKHKIQWQKNKKKYFTGPILFLVAFYVDRVVQSYRSVPRSFPIVKNWTYLELKRRENAEISTSGFGRGFTSEPISIHQVDFTHPTEGVTLDQTCKDKSSPLATSVNYNEKHLYVDEFMKKAKMMAQLMVEIMDMVTDAPKHMMGSLEHLKISEAAQQLLGCSDKASTSNATPAQSQFLDTQAEDEYWGNPDIIALVEKIEATIIKRNDFNIIVDDGPSFSLGFTQDGCGGFGSVMSDIDDMVLQDQTEDEPCSKKSRVNVGVKINENICISTDGREENHTGDIVHKKSTYNVGSFVIEPVNANNPSSVSNGKGKEKVADYWSNRVPLASVPSRFQGNVLKTKENVKEVDTQTHSCPKNSGPSKHKGVVLNDTGKENVIPFENSMDKVMDASLHCKQTKVNSRLDQKLKQKPSSHTMERRNRADIKKSEMFMSPWIDRVVDVSAKLYNVEKELWFWIFHNNDGNMEDVLFADGVVGIRKMDLMTIAMDAPGLSTNMLDAWSSLMNHKELSRAVESPCRFYASTRLCFFAADQWNGSSNVLASKEKFFTSLHYEITRAEGMTISDIDMFFFPFYHQQHFQLVCFDVRKFRRDLFDCKKGSKGDYLAPGITVPSMLTDFFIQFLLRNGLSVKASGLKKAELTRIEASTKDKINPSDSGIYAMRIMETYMGDGLKNWKTGLRINSVAQFKKLRIKYCSEFLAAEVNVYRARNMKNANLHYRLSSEDGPIKFEQLVLRK